ncbi:MAG: NAD(P)-binding domain-containing protein, partial [Planctomycetota bacterium]
MERTDYELIIVGAGPVGLACAIAAQRAGIEYVALERGCVVNSVFRFPTQMTFFTTPELMEIGEHPLVAGPFGKPTRSEALDYYRGVTRAEDLNVRTYEDVHSVEGEKGAFRVSATHKGRTRDFTSELVVLATGYYDCPNYLGIPGEDLPHVNHYYTEAHPHSGQKVLVVGGANSACVSSLDLYRRGADVTLVHRGDRFA